jgi:hypothetical protein
MDQYTEDMDSAAKSLGLEPPAWYSIIPAYTFEPDPISVPRIRVRIPYNSPAYYEESLLSLFELGCFDEVLDGEYLLNERGHEAFESIIHSAYQQMNEIPHLSPDSMEELQHLLYRLVQASLLSDEPTCKWSIIYSRRLDPGRDASAIIKVDQYLSDLTSYRDDAHLASWQSHEISGHAWDILGVIWSGEAASMGEIAERLKSRKWAETESVNAIAELENRGWIVAGEEMCITEQGSAAREKSEELTDQYFFSPWGILSEEELVRLGNLLKELKDKIDSNEGQINLS